MKAENYILTEANKMFIFSALNRVIAENVLTKKEKIGVIIKNLTSVRHDGQNKLLHAIFKQISDLTASTGKGERVSAVTIKAALKDKFLGYTAIQLKKKIVYELKSTARLTKKECAEFTNNIIQWCQDTNIPLVLKTNDYNYLMGLK